MPKISELPDGSALALSGDALWAGVQGGITYKFTARQLNDVGSNETRTIILGTATIAAADIFIYINFAGTVAITMPDSTAWLAVHGVEPLVIQDISGAANDTTRLITITRAGSDTINGGTAIEIVSPYGGYKLRPPAAGSWVIQ